MRKGTLLLTLILALTIATSAHAYVGPGAGFAFITSFFFLIATFFVALFSLMIWPIRFFFVWIKSRRAMRHAKVRRVIVLGMDGLDPDLVEKWMSEGHLPNFQKLADQGQFNRLATTYPAVSPVAWSSFMTGANPGRHNIYDFLSRDKRTYLPELSSAYIGGSSRSIKLGKYTIPLGKPELRLLRKSKPFWKILGEHGVFSNILRVPITFPPEKFNGLSISGMCVPDIRGTQGTFTMFTTRKDKTDNPEGGIVLPLTKNGKGLTGQIPGPPNPLLEGNPEIQIPFTLTPNGNGSAQLVLPDKKYTLKVGEYTDWAPLTFKAGLKVNVGGITRFLLTESGNETSLYLTPINLDPERPAFPISHPKAYSMYFSKMLGYYANLGLNEDTWALNEGAINDRQFLAQTELIHTEREAMFLDALEKTSRGAVVCVFDDSDRIQHMFYRYLVKDHPALPHYEDTGDSDAILTLYKAMDEMLGRVMKKIRPKDAFMVMSDHGFKPFNRGINLNSWLHQNGYLTLKDGADGSSKWLADVDWSKTRAYQVGLGGLYLNVKGREAKGIVEPVEADALIRELIEKLNGLTDEEKDEVGINKVWAAKDIYKGPYVGNAPDLLIGYNVGYRAGWDGTTGVITNNVFTDNTKAWSGDHCMDPRKVPGVLFSNFKLEKSPPSIMDVAPTVLDFLGVKAPKYMDGESMLKGKNKETAS